jgi:chromosome segregation ATPase
MTEFLWVALGLGLGLVIGFLLPRRAKRAAPVRDIEADLRGQLGRAKSALEDSKLEVARALAASDALEAEVKSLKVRLPKLEGFERANADLRLQLQGFDAVKARLEAASAELEETRPQVAASAALSTKLEAVQIELSDLKTRTAGFEGIQQRAATAAELEAKVAVLELEKARLLTEANASALKASDAEAAQKKIRAALAESVAEVARTREGMQQFAALKTKIDDLEARGVSPEPQSRIDVLERDLQAARLELPTLKDSLHQRNAELTATRDRLAMSETLIARLGTLEAALASRESELERLRSQVISSEAS